MRDRFASAGLETPGLDARILTLDALGIDATALLTRPERPVSGEGAARLAAHAARRLAREPVARILGEREFWGLPFRLSPETLVPRPDTEAVVGAALGAVQDRCAALRVLDLGTGSGCLLVALLHELAHATGVGLDRSEDAVGTARRNAGRNGVAPRAVFAVSDWAAPIAGRFDLVVSNPPYIETRTIAALAPEVSRHDPFLALNGGIDGLDAHRAIFAEADRLIAPAGIMVVEFGMGQEAAVAAQAEAAGLVMAGVEADLEGRPRAALMRRA